MSRLTTKYIMSTEYKPTVFINGRTGKKDDGLGNQTPTTKFDTGSYDGWAPNDPHMPIGLQDYYSPSLKDRQEGRFNNTDAEIAAYVAKIQASING
jgi:hypothetical protein